MNYSRRDLGMLIGLAAAAGAAVPQSDADKQVLPAKVYQFADLEVKTSANGNKSRKVFQGALHNGFVVNCHITELALGQMPHPPHHHPHEEIIMLKEGTVEVTVDGKVTKFGAGGVSFISSGVEHSMRNIGTGQAIYFVVEMRGDGK
jgi:quercetin dioxygenase-like cupin family protein